MAQREPFLGGGGRSCINNYDGKCMASLDFKNVEMTFLNDYCPPPPPPPPPAPEPILLHSKSEMDDVDATRGVGPDPVTLTSDHDSSQVSAGCHYGIPYRRWRITTGVIFVFSSANGSLLSHRALFLHGSKAESRIKGTKAVTKFSCLWHYYYWFSYSLPSIDKLVFALQSRL